MLDSRVRLRVDIGFCIGILVLALPESFYRIYVGWAYKKSEDEAFRKSVACLRLTKKTKTDSLNKAMNQWRQ